MDRVAARKNVRDLHALMCCSAGTYEAGVRSMATRAISADVLSLDQLRRFPRGVKMTTLRMRRGAYDEALAAWAREGYEAIGPKGFARHAPAHVDVRGTTAGRLVLLWPPATLRSIVLNLRAVPDGIDAVNLRALAACGDRLETLKVCTDVGAPIRDLSPLARLTGIRTLFLEYVMVGDVGPLATLTALESLTLHSDDEGIVSLSALSALQRLTHLDVYCFPATAETGNAVRALAGSLRHLHLGHLQNPLDDAALAACTGLTRLDVLDPFDLRALDGMRSLAELHLTDDEDLVTDADVADVARRPGLAVFRGERRILGAPGNP